jgi:cysteine-rich repeat protein
MIDLSASAARNAARRSRPGRVFLPPLSALTICLLTACGGGDAPPPAAELPPEVEHDAGHDAGADAPASGGSGGSAGSDGSAGSGGRHEADAAKDSSPDVDAPGEGGPDRDASAPEAGRCGDGVVGPHEFCDGAELNNANCAVFGYAGGVLRCNSSCAYDFSRCEGTELCFNGSDDDGDRAIDCADTDCSSACSTSCASATLVLDPGHVNGSTRGHAAEVASSCLPPGASSGPEVVFRVKPSVTGVLEATVSSIGADFSLSIRKDCADESSELVCRNLGAGAGAVETVRTAVTRGQDVFLVVDGADPNQEGLFVLDLASRPVECGDGNLDPGEACDDRNRLPDDGCSASCELELDEVEPNEATSSATPYTSLPFIARISSASDIDVFSIAVSAPNSMLSVETLDLGDGACARMELDDRIEILAPDGHTLISNDDGGVGFCAKASVTGLAPGTYYVRVQASGVASAFPYNLDISRSP